MTYKHVVKRGWFCRCGARPPQETGHDTWENWQLCRHCRLPIEGSNLMEGDDGEAGGAKRIA